MRWRHGELFKLLLQLLSEEGSGLWRGMGPAGDSGCRTNEVLGVLVRLWQHVTNLMNCCAVRAMTLFEWSTEVYVFIACLFGNAKKRPINCSLPHLCLSLTVAPSLYLLNISDWLSRAAHYSCILYLVNNLPFTVTHLFSWEGMHAKFARGFLDKNFMTWMRRDERAEFVYSGGVAGGERPSKTDSETYLVRYCFSSETAYFVQNISWLTKISVTSPVHESLQRLIAILVLTQLLYSQKEQHSNY